MSESKPRKPKPLNAAWSCLLKNEKVKNQKVAETEPWRCKYCNSDAERRTSLFGLKVHLQRKHKFFVKGGITLLRDIEKPSARPNRFVLPSAMTK